MAALPQKSQSFEAGELERFFTALLSGAESLPVRGTPDVSSAAAVPAQQTVSLSKSAPPVASRIGVTTRPDPWPIEVWIDLSVLRRRTSLPAVEEETSAAEADWEPPPWQPSWQREPHLPTPKFATS